MVGSSLAQNTPPYFLYLDFFEVRHLHSVLGGWLHSVTHNIFYVNMHWFDLMWLGLFLIGIALFWRRY